MTETMGLMPTLFGMVRRLVIKKQFRKAIPYIGKKIYKNTKKYHAVIGYPEYKYYKMDCIYVHKKRFVNRKYGPIFYK